MLTLFSIRFLVEFIKESQGGFETLLPLFSTGQWLSIPLIVSGIVVFNSINKYLKKLIFTYFFFFGCQTLQGLQ